MNILIKKLTANNMRIPFILLVVCILAISIFFLTISTNKPYMGLTLLKGDSGWYVGTVDDTGVARASGIQVGDIPLFVNNQPADTFLVKYDSAKMVWSPLINQLTVKNSSGEIITATFDNYTPSKKLVAEITIEYIVCLFWWIPGLYVLYKKPDNLASRLFIMCCVCVGLLLIANTANMRGVDNAVYFEVAFTILGPWLLMHLFINLPQERIFPKNKIPIYFIYLIPLITFILFVTIGYVEGQPVMWFRSFRFFEYGVGFVATISVVAYNYVKSTSLRTRQQTKIILIGCLAALIPILIINLLPQALWQQATIPPGFSVIFLVFIPLSIAYAIVTQKLLDIDVIIRRSIIYGLVTLTMAVVLGVAIIFTTSFQDVLNTSAKIAVALILGGIATALFGPVKKGVEYIIDKLFYKDRFDYRSIIQNLSISLNTINDFSAISRLIVGTTVNTLNLRGACLFTQGTSSIYDVRTAQGIFTDGKKQKILESYLSKLNTLNVFPNPAIGIDPDVSFFVPFITGNKKIGILCLSHKTNRQDYSSGDIYLLQGIASVAAMALHRTMLIRDVNLRDTFVSVASHELRTPLTSIIGYADLMLQRDPPQNTRVKWLGYILESGQRLNSLVNDLLNVSRIQSGRVSVKLTAVDIAPLIDEILTITSSSPDNHKFVVNIPPDFPQISADHNKFSQVLSNLISNAVKYSPWGGTITVAAGYDDGKNRGVISVADEGIGISQEDKHTLFMSFHRIQRPETQGIRGSGLGLYIAKEWTEAMGGEIWLQSELNKGSTFFVSIPFAELGKVSKSA